MRCYKAVLSYIAVLLTGMIFLSSVASAGVTIAGTRIIFPAAEREKSVRTNNKGDSPVLVQVWVDDGSKTDDLNQMKVPFTVTPPVYRINPGKGQSVRLIYNGMNLPDDRESVYRFNLLEIPTVSDADKNKDRLELAFRTRVKIFYRPSGLKESSVDHSSELKWSIDRQTQPATVKITNPTPYYFSFESVNAVSGSKRVAIEPAILAPFSDVVFTPVDKQPLPASLTAIEFNLLNDYGSIVSEKVKYQQGKGWVADLSARRK